MLAEAKQDPQLMNYLPDEKELHLLPRQWLANVIYTRIGENFIREPYDLPVDT